MTAEGKLTTNDITHRPLGTVRVLVTTGSSGALIPATRKTGAVAATVTGVTAAAGNRRTRYELATDQGIVPNVAPHQTFWLAPAAPAAGAERVTVAQLRAAEPGTRVLITDEYEYAGGGSGTWRAARKPVPKSWQTAPGEPCGIHAATVERVEPADAGRYHVVTNLGTVENVTAGQAFRLAPADMRDTAVVRAEMRAEREAREARQAYDRANPRDVDRVNVAPGDLVELLGASRWHTPAHVARAIGATSCGFLIVPRPYEREYGETPAGASISIGFRRLANQDDSGGLAVRSCGCPAPIRQTLVPPPERYDIRRMDMEDADETRHRPDCHWATMCDAPGLAYLRVLPGCDDDGRETFTVHASSIGAGETCGCPGVDRHSGDPMPAADRAGALLTLFPPQHHPDRDGLAERVTFAGCCPLPDTAPAAPFVSAWTGLDIAGEASA